MTQWCQTPLRPRVTSGSREIAPFNIILGVGKRILIIFFVPLPAETPEKSIKIKQ